jgi:hypothetical protein
MTKAPEPSRYQKVSSTARRILALGESGRYEFKRDVDVVTPKLLAALANWVALDPARDVAHLLVGVEEIEDGDTGLVYGKPFGLPKGLDKAVARIQDMASKTRPIPVDAFIVEEGVSLRTPFLRIELRPTMPPHFDDEGRRQTRQGRSTRALTDDELLRIYLDREAGSFATRFRQTATELQSAVGVVGSQVDQIAEGIEKNIAQPIQDLTATTQEAADAASSAASAADSATSSADTAAYEVEHVQRLVRDLQEVVEKLHDDLPQNLAHRVRQRRREVWWNFTVDTFEHTSARARRLADRLRELLSSDVSLDSARNSWEFAVWQDLLDDRKSQRGKRGTQKWWDAAIKEVGSFMESPAYAAPNLPDLRAAIQADIDTEVDDPDSATNRFRALLDAD